jgi:hypothetical protein
MSRDETGLTDRECYLLGTLAQATSGRRKLPRAHAAEADRLVQGGYLERTATRAPGGTEITRYHVTDKGWAVWQAYRFLDPLPEPRKK